MSSPSSCRVGNGLHYGPRSLLANLSLGSFPLCLCRLAAGRGEVFVTTGEVTARKPRCRPVLLIVAAVAVVDVFRDEMRGSSTPFALASGRQNDRLGHLSREEKLEEEVRAREEEEKARRWGLQRRSR